MNIEQLREKAHDEKNRRDTILTPYILGRECDMLSGSKPRTFEVEVRAAVHRNYLSLLIRRRNRVVRARFEAVFLYLSLDDFSANILAPLMPAFQD